MQPSSEPESRSRVASQSRAAEYLATALSIARAPPPVLLGRAGEGKVNRARRRSGRLAVHKRPLLSRRGRRGLERSADVEAERRVGQEGEALARVESRRRHCDGDGLDGSGLVRVMGLMDVMLATARWICLLERVLGSRLISSSVSVGQRD